MSGFQIPGLTTLSQPQTTSMPVQAEKQQEKNADIKSADSMVVDEPEAPQNSDPTATTISKPAEDINGDGANNMIDQTDLTTSSTTPVTASNEQIDKEMSGVSNTTAPIQQSLTAQPETGPGDAPPSPPSLTSGLEALLGGLDPEPAPPVNETAQTEATAQVEEGAEPVTENGEQEHPEWEEDSSPYESSSEESSSSDSDDDSEDDKDYPMLGPEETARLLMEMEGGSDDEGGEGKAKGSGSGAQVRTKNELPEEVIPVPDVKIEDDAEIIELGTIEHIVETTIVVRANTTGEYRVLDSGSVLCTAERKVIAAIADLIGSVRQPRYTARFTSREQMDNDFGLALGTTIFYTPAHASYVFTQALQGEKGTDASNWHDEEAGVDEMEFSDDEKEAEYKRQLKAKRKGGAGGRGGKEGGRGGAPRERAGRQDQNPQQQHPTALKYDDDDDEDGPYKPLARPPGFGQGPPASQSVETGYGANNYAGHRGNNNHQRGGRGGRGGNRGRGNRGGPRGGGGNSGGYSLPPRPQQQQQYQQHQPPQQAAFTPPPQQPQFNYPLPPTPQFPFPWPPNPNMVPPPPPPPQFTNPQQQQQATAAAAAMAGMYFNPAFYNAGGQWPGQQNNQSGG